MKIYTVSSLPYIKSIPEPPEIGTMVIYTSDKGTPAAFRKASQGNGGWVFFGNTTFYTWEDVQNYISNGNLMAVISP